VPSSNVIGSFKLNVAGVTNGSAHQLSNKNKILFGSGSWHGGSNTLSASYLLFDDGRDCLFYLSDNTGEIRYQFLENINDNDVFDISFANMNKFDRLVKATFPSTKKGKIYYWVNKGDPNKADIFSGFLTNCNLSNTYFGDNNSITEINLGYLDTFSIYNTVLSIGYDTLSYNYHRFGDRPEAITFPLTSKFTLNNRTITDFDFTHNQPYVRKSSFWLNINSTSTLNTSINWVVHSPSQNNQRFKELPNEFNTKYPRFSFANLRHFSTNFFTQGTSYADLINTTFKGQAKEKYFETYSIEVR
jgi:hypothetical protein